MPPPNQIHLDQNIDRHIQTQVLRRHYLGEIGIDIVTLRRCLSTPLNNWYWVFVFCPNRLTTEKEAQPLPYQLLFIGELQYFFLSFFYPDCVLKFALEFLIDDNRKRTSRAEVMASEQSFAELLSTLALF